MLNALTQFSEKILLGKSLRLRKRHRLWQRRREVQLDTVSYCLVNSTYSSLLWVSFSTWPSQKAKDQSCGLWATSSSGNCPFPWQKRGTKWSSKSLPRQTILWLHDSKELLLPFYFDSEEQKTQMYPIQWWDIIWKSFTIFFTSQKTNPGTQTWWYKL